MTSVTDPRVESDDDRKTPVPNLELDAELRAEFQEFLRAQRDQRKRGFTIERLFRVIEKFQEAYDIRLEKVELWQRQHDEMHEREGAMKKSPSLPPMRPEMDTQSFLLNRRDLEKVRSDATAAILEQERAFAKYREGQANAVIVELKDERTWWIRTVLFGGFGAIALAIFVWWLAKH